MPLSILLDLDGTIVDSEPGILASARATLAALGHDTNGIRIRGLIGPPLEEVLAALLAPLGDDRVPEAVLAYRAHYGNTGLLETTAYPGIEAALDRLLALGAQLFIATSKRTLFAGRILRHLGLDAKFSGIHGSEPGGVMDHKADIIAHVLKTHALDANTCLMVGDRRHDVLGAEAHAMPAVGVLWGYGDRAELESAGARHVIARPDELVAIAEALAVA